MKYQRKGLILCLGFLAALSACGGGPTKQARSVEEPKQSLIGLDYSMLQPGKENQALLAYDSGTDLSNYKKLLIDPVLFEQPEGMSKSDLAEMKQLADSAAALLVQELGQDYTLVKDIAPNTLRLQTAFYDPSKRRVAMSAISSVVPFGVAASVVKEVAIGKPSAVGELTGEAKLTDAVNGTVYAAGLDRRVGKMYASTTFSRWGDVLEAFKFYAKQIRYRLCVDRHGSSCVKPE